jgi:hypothetical protein
MAASMDSLVAVSALTIRTFFALYFLFAIAHKLGDRDRFRRAIAAYAVLPDGMVRPVAPVFIGLEVIAVALLIFADFAVSGLLSIAALLTVYAAAIASAKLRNLKLEDCGCGGISGDAAPEAWHLQRNVLLIALSLAGALAAQQSGPAASGVASVGLLLGTVLTVLCLALEGLRANEHHFSSRSTGQ